MGFRDTAPDAPWRTRLDATIAAQHARARALARLGGTSSQSTHVIPAHAVIQDPPVPRCAGAQQERQHSAAAGGTRDRLPPASGSIAASRRVGINFAFVISSQWCACRCTVCAYSLSEFFYRGRHGQESEEGKEDRQGSHQEGRKENFQKKEVTVSTTDKLPPPGRNPDAKRHRSKGSRMSFAAVRCRGRA
jgi:hypothetical protein